MKRAEIHLDTMVGRCGEQRGAAVGARFSCAVATRRLAFFCLLCCLWSTADGQVSEASSAAKEFRMCIIQTPEDVERSYLDCLLAVDSFNTGNSSVTSAVLAGKVAGVHIQPHHFLVSTVKEAVAAAISCRELGGDGAVLPSVTEMADAVLFYLKVHEIPAVAGGLYSDYFSNKELYPYFARTVASDAALGDALFHVLSSIGWEHVGMLRFTGNQYVDELLDKTVQHVMPAAGLEVMIYAKYEPGNNDSARLAVRKIKESHAHIIICVLESTTAYDIMKEAMALGMVSSNHVWIIIPGGYGLLSGLVHAAAHPDAMMEMLDGVFEPIPASAPDPLRWQRYIESRQAQSMSYLQEAYPEYFAALPEDMVPSDATLRNSLLQRKPTPAVITNANAYDAVLMLALGLSNSIGSEGDNTAEAVMDAILANPFEGLTGRVMLDGNGDRQASDYMLLNYRVNESDSSTQFAPVRAATLSWKPSDNEWSLSLLPTSPSTGFMFHGGSTTVPHDNFQCPNGVCELCWIMPPGYEFLASLIAVDHVNNRINSVAPALNSRLHGIFLRPHMKPENASHVQRHSRECSDIHGDPAVGLIGTSDISISFTLQQSLGRQHIPQVSPWGSVGSSIDSLAGASVTYLSMLPPSSLLVETALRTAVRFGWRRVAFLEESSTKGFLLGSYVSQQLQARQDISSVIEARFLGYESAIAALQMIKEAHAHVIIVVADVHFKAVAQAARVLGMNGRGYAWLSVAIKPQQLQRQIASWPAEDRGGIDGWLFVQNDIDDSFSQAWDAFREAALAFNLSYYQDLYPEAFEQLGPAAMELDIVGLADVDSLPLSALAAYDTVVAFAYALTSAGERGSMEVSRLLVNQSFSGLTGEVSMDAEGQRQGTQQTVLNYWHTVSANGTVETSRMLKVLQLALHNSENGTIQGGAKRTDVAMRWPGGAEGVPRDGFSCGDGLFLNDSFECEECQRGTYLDMERNMAECRACPEGTFCNSRGCKLCLPCDEDQYQDSQKAATCASCPTGTSTQMRGAVSVRQCDCMPGFYRIRREPGHSCFACPELGVCDGGAMLPYPAIGAWGDVSVVNSSAFLELGAEAQANGLANHLFVPCDLYNGGCNRKCPGADSVAAEQQCRTDPEQVCDVGYEKEACASCASDYFNMLGECRLCPEHKVAVVACGLSAVVVVWFLINKVVANRYESLSLMLSWLQLATMISTFRLNWHPKLKLMFELLTVVNFDIDFFPPDCAMSGSRWGFGPSLIVEITLPIFWMAINGLLYTINWALLKARSHFLIRLLRMASTPDELAMDLDYRIASSISFLNITYHTTTMKCFSVFLCTAQPDGSAFLNQSPSTLCHSTAHQLYMALGSVGLLLYSVGLPVLMAYILYRGRTQNLFEKPYFSRRYGWLYLKWETDWYWWEAVFVARRFLFSLIVVFLAAYPSLQAGLAIVVLLASMGAQFYSRAFFDVSLDVQDSLQLCSLIGMVIIGQLFYDSEIHKNISGLHDALNVALFTLMGISVAAVMVMSLLQITQVEKRNLVLRYLKSLSKIYEAQCAPGVGAESGEESNVRRYTDLHPAFNANLMYVWVQQVRRRNMKLKKSMRKAGNAERESGPLTEATQPEDGSEASTTKGTLENPGMPPPNSWLIAILNAATSNKNASIRMRMEDAQVANGLLRLNTRYHQVLNQEQDMSNGDENMTLASYYSFDKRSAFYRQLVEHVPALLDYLLTCNSGQREAARDMLAKIEELVARREESGLVAEVILPKDRANVVCWLLSAERADVQLSKQVLTAIWHRAQPPLKWQRSTAGTGTGTDFERQRFPKSMVQQLLGSKRMYHIHVDLQFARDLALRPYQRCIAADDGDSSSDDDDDRAHADIESSSASNSALLSQRKKKVVVRFAELLQQQINRSLRSAVLPEPVETRDGPEILSSIDEMRPATVNVSEVVRSPGSLEDLPRLS